MFVLAQLSSRKTQLLGLQPGLQLAPDTAGFGNVGTRLFGRSERLFFSVRPSRDNVFHTVPMLALMPCLRRSQSRNSAIVVSGRPAISAAIAACRCTSKRMTGGFC